MSVANQLNQLQELDLEIESAEQSLAEKTARLGDRQVLDDAQGRLDSEKKRLAEMKQQQHDAEWDVDDILSKIAAAEGQLYGGKITNPKELSNLQHEAATMKSRSDDLETRALEIIDRVEETEGKVTAATNDLTKLEEEWQKEQVQLAGDIEKINITLADLRQQRQQLSGEINPPAIELYERIRHQKKPPVARVERGICRVCRISLSASDLQRVRGETPVQCGSCGRILFLS